jgi:hypothetical protein
MDKTDIVTDNKEKAHALETRIQTVAMVLIVGFLSWVGTGLVDVKVGLAQVLSESVSLRDTLNRQANQIKDLEKEVGEIRKEAGDFVTRDELRQSLRDLPPN